MFALQFHEFSGQLVDPQEEWGAALVPGSEEDIRSQSFSVFNVSLITKIGFFKGQFNVEELQQCPSLCIDKKLFSSRAKRQA
jgi:hypothetical protein